MGGVDREREEVEDDSQISGWSDWGDGEIVLKMGRPVENRFGERCLHSFQFYCLCLLVTGVI